MILIGLLLLQLATSTVVYAQENKKSYRIEKETLSQMPHALTLKTGLHLYRNSDFFDSNAAFFDQKDLTSLAAELEYDYLWYSPSTLGLAIGYYDGRTDFETICCSEVAFSTLYALLTLKYHFKLKPVTLKRLKLYVGPGMGYYLFNREIKVLDVRNDLSEKIFGFHYLLGARLFLSPRVSLLVEARYTSAVIRSANELDDELNIGGWTTFFGLSWQFPDFAHIFPERGPEPPEERVILPPVEKPPEEKPVEEIPMPKIPKEVPEVEIGLQDVYFDLDKAAIREGARQVLEKNARWLVAHPDVKVLIEGHCDEQGTNEYNLALGERRAQAGKRFLMALGIDENRLSTISYGEERPVCLEKTEECFVKNRRIRFTLR